MLHRKQLIFIICWAMMWVIAIVASLMFPEKVRAESVFAGIELAKQAFAMQTGDVAKLFLL
ncbi:MAG: hypothetical protein N3A59_06250 [Thermodesulfovibrionales bacterium]|nr:hypothetical protein [Thermodesulfovibrionales bacterium]